MPEVPADQNTPPPQEGSLNLDEAGLHELASSLQKSITPGQAQSPEGTRPASSTPREPAHTMSSSSSSPDNPANQGNPTHTAAGPATVAEGEHDDRRTTLGDTSTHSNTSTGSRKRGRGGRKHLPIHAGRGTDDPSTGHSSTAGPAAGPTTGMEAAGATLPRRAGRPPGLSLIHI